MTQEETVKLVFSTKHKDVRIEIKKDYYTLWDNSMGRGFSTLTDCLNYMTESLGEYKLKGVTINQSKTIEI